MSENNLDLCKYKDIQHLSFFIKQKGKLGMRRGSGGLWHVSICHHLITMLLARARQKGFGLKTGKSENSPLPFNPGQ